MSRRIKYICQTCGSDELVFDTTSSWNVDTQSFVLEGETDHNPCCNSETCMGEETMFHTIDLTTGKRIKMWYGEWLPLADYALRLEEHMSAQRNYQNGCKALELAAENATILGQALEIADGQVETVQD